MYRNETSVRTLVSALCVSILTLAVVGAASAEVFEVPPEQGIQFGQGINTVSLQPLGFCLAPDPVNHPSPSQKVVVEARRLDSRDELETFLKIDAEASLDGPLTANGKFQFLRETYRLETTTYLFVKVSVRNPTQNLTEHRWKNPFIEDLATSSPKDFFAACGDRFVHGVTTGGELVAEIGISHVTEKEKTDVGAHLDANFKVVKGLADLVEKLKKLHEETRFSYRLYRQGSIGSIEFDPGTLMEQVEKFPQEVLNNPSNMSFETLPYSVLLGAGAPDVSRERRYINELAKLRNEWQDRADRLASVHDDLWQFAPDVPAIDLQKEIATARSFVASIDSAFYACVAALPYDCETNVPIAPEPYAVPKRILLDRLWLNGGMPGWCRASVATKPYMYCNSQPVGFIVTQGPWTSTELFEAPQPATGRLLLWTEEKGPSAGYTLASNYGMSLYACGSGRVVGKKSACLLSQARFVGYTYNPIER